MVLKAIVAVHAQMKKVWDFLIEPSQLGIYRVNGTAAGKRGPDRNCCGVISIQGHN